MDSGYFDQIPPAMRLPAIDALLNRISDLEGRMHSLNEIADRVADSIRNSRFEELDVHRRSVDRLAANSGM